MTTSYSQSLRLWEGSPFDPAIKGAWGGPLSTNFTLLENAITGQGTVNIAGLTTYSLTTANGATDQARYQVYNFTGALTGNCTVTMPNVPKVGWAVNNTTGGYNVVLSAGSGTTATLVPGGAWFYYAADGAGNVTLVSVGLPSLTANYLLRCNGTSAVAQSLIYDNGASVGINTTSPGYALDVLSTDTTLGYAVRIRANATAGVGGLQFTDAGVTVQYGAIRATSAYNMLFLTSGVEAMRVNASAQVLVGTTTDLVGEQFNATGTNWAAGFQNSANGSAVWINNGSGTSAYNAVVFYNNGTSFSQCGAINVSGTTTSYVTSSDYRLKTNVQPLKGGLDTIAALRPVTYQWKSDDGPGEGFIAHELAAVIPLAVTGEKDALDDKGEIKPQGVDYSKIVVHLVAALQELKAEFDAYRAAHP